MEIDKFNKNSSDIFNLDYKKIEKLDGWDFYQLANLKNAIIKLLKCIVLDKFIFSIGIRHIGQENAKISKLFQKIEKF